MRLWSWIRVNTATLAVVVPVIVSVLGGAWYVGATTATRSDVNELRETVTDSAETLGNLSGTIDTLGGTVDTLSGTVGNLQQTVGRLSETLGDLRGTVDTLSGTVAAVDDLRAAVDDVRNAIPNLVACMVDLHRPSDRSPDFREPNIPEVCEQMRAQARGAGR